MNEKYSTGIYQDENGKMTLVLFMRGIFAPEYAAYVEKNVSVERACAIANDPNNKKLWAVSAHWREVRKQAREIMDAVEDGELVDIYFEEERGTRSCPMYVKQANLQQAKGEALEFLVKSGSIAETYSMI